MADARGSARASPRPHPRPAARQRPRAIAGGGQGIRWDRIGRVGLLVVLCGLLYLYIGPAVSYVETWQEAKERRAQVEELRRENRKLRARRDALRDAGALEREARRLGMVRPGERPYIVRGIAGE